MADLDYEEFVLDQVYAHPQTRIVIEMDNTMLTLLVSPHAVWLSQGV